MQLVRKSDGLILCDEIENWSDWYYDYHHAVISTVTGNEYDDLRGVALLKQDLTLRFAAHYPNANRNNFVALLQAGRRKRDLRLTDAVGVVSDVRLVTRLDKDAVTRWEDVPTKSIRIVQVTVRKLEYIQ